MLIFSVPNVTLVYVSNHDIDFYVESKCLTSGKLPDDKSFSEVKLWSPLTDIGHLCFADCEELTSITLPSTISSIGYRAFYGCKKLKKVVIPDNIDEIKVWFSGGVQMRMYPPFEGIADLLREGYQMEFNPMMSWSDWN